MLTAYIAARGLFGGGEVSDAVVLVDDGKIRACGPASEVEISANAQLVDFGNALLAPAFLDVHCHGSAGHDVMESSPDGELRMASFLASHGVGKFLPTTVTASADSTLAALDRLADWIERETGAGSARPVGIHLEGPFICAAKRGVQPAEHIQLPSVELFDRYWQAARGHIRLMTVAPEMSGALELIAYASAKGVRVSLGHSDATAAQGRAGMVAGAVSATHCYNAMRGMDHREPGLLGMVLDAKGLYAELICDGHHCSDEAVRLFAAAKLADRRILITDAISATGMGDGRFKLGELEVEVAGTQATLDGKLAGSVLTLDRGVERFVAATGLAVAEAAAAGATNPAAMLGLEAGLQVGGPADFVLLGRTGGLLATVVGGARV